MDYTNKLTVSHISVIRAEHKNMSIPDGADLSDIGWFVIEDVAPPTGTDGYAVVAGQPEQYAPEKWRQTWVIESLPPPPIPQSVTMRQACIQLEVDGLLDDVEAIVATLPRVYQIEWQRASNVFRDNPLVEMVRQQQGMTATQIDDLFIAAEKR